MQNNSRASLNATPALGKTSREGAVRIGFLARWMGSQRSWDTNFNLLLIWRFFA